MIRMNRRKRVLVGLGVSVLFLVILGVGGLLLGDAATASDLGRKNLAPCRAHWFGTDWLGRDMLARTVRGLSVSIWIGILAAAVSAVIALVLGVASATMGNMVDKAVSFCIDLVMGIPHILLLVLICVACGRGMRGVVTGVALTHWTSLARVIRAEVLQLRESPYIQIAGKLGKGRMYIAVKHMLPHLLPQFLVGLVLLFPHAILHEASVTFLGFGLSSEQPAIGNVLSESMQYLITGNWWLGVFPGVMLVITVLAFYGTGENLRKLLSPGSAHE